MKPKGHVPKFIFAHPANQRPQTLLASGSNSASGLGFPLSLFQVAPAKSSATWKALITLPLFGLQQDPETFMFPSLPPDATYPKLALNSILLQVLCYHT